MRETIIAIPSYKRAQWLLTGETNALIGISKEEMRNTFLVVREAEAGDYHYVAEKFGCQLRIIPMELTDANPDFNIRETRDFIFDAFLEECKYLFVIEDDQRLDMRANDKGNYCKMDNVDVEFAKAMELVKRVDMEAPMASFLPRLFCVGKSQTFAYMNADWTQVTMYYSPFFLLHSEYRYKFGPKYMEDYSFGFKVATAGYGIMIFTDYVKQDVLIGTRCETTPEHGGCNALGRKTEELDKCALEIAQRYPEYATAYVKVRPSTWGDKPTLGLRTAWAKLAKCYKGAPKW